jgi:2-keto-4-pentenoate hydratase/2-oxohepta-3-ene-1,7-dioic acid hydratase in catechol pathway
VTKQDGLAGDMIYSPEEQIEYASKKMTLESGDLFATGTLAGVGQGSGVFLKPGDLVECEVAGLGMQRNRVVASTETY